MKKRKVLVIGGFSIVILFALMSCKSQKEMSNNVAVSTAKTIIEDSLLVKIKREACFGRCPQYDATIYKSGFAEYYGEMNVKKIGTWNAYLTQEQLSSLQEAIRQYKMEALDTVYSNPYLADFPSYFLWVSDKKPRKKILINHESPPVEITEFTQTLEGLIDLLRWEQSPKARKDEE